MTIIEGPQYGDLWLKVRRGIPTASEFDKIITPAKGELSSSAINYVCQLIADRYSPSYGQIESYVSAAMKNGSDTEPEARRFYELQVDCDVKQVCFCVSDCGRFGCSPDGLVGESGGLELKCPEPHTHVKYLLDECLPDKYKPQVHGELAITGREWWDFMSHAPGLPPLIVRVTPNDYTKRLRDALEAFDVLLKTTLAELNLPDPPAPEVDENADLSPDDLPAMLVH